jgi:hypothetical protein
MEWTFKWCTVHYEVITNKTVDPKKELILNPERKDIEYVWFWKEIIRHAVNSASVSWFETME